MRSGGMHRRSTQRGTFPMAGLLAPHESRGENPGARPRVARRAVSGARRNGGMRMTDRRRQVCGVAAVVAAFWLGFVCGGGGVLSEAAASGQPPGEPAPASQPPPVDPATVPDDSDPASQPPADPAPVPDDPDPASQPPADPAPVPDDPDPASQPPADPAPVPDDPDPASQPPADPAPVPDDPDPASQPPADPAPVPDDPAQGDAGPDQESPPADSVPEESLQAEPETETRPEPPLVQDRPREFTARTGIVLYFVRQDAESTFEEAMTRVAEAFAASESEERQEQAEGWSMYKAEEPLADGARLYVSWIDPVVPGADYWVPGILNEAFPTEAQTLYETYAGAFADGQILLNLAPVRGP